MSWITINPSLRILLKEGRPAFTARPPMSLDAAAGLVSNYLDSHPNDAQAAAWLDVAENELADRDETREQQKLEESFAPAPAAVTLQESRETVRRKRGFDQAEAEARLGNYGQAAAMFRALANDGDPRAQTWLGRLYREGRGVAKDAAQAVLLFQFAADKGHPEAQRELGIAYRDGRGVTADLASARRWLEVASNNGDLEARRALRELAKEQ